MSSSLYSPLMYLRAFKVARRALQYTENTSVQLFLAPDTGRTSANVVIECNVDERIWPQCSLSSIDNQRQTIARGT